VRLYGSTRVTAKAHRKKGLVTVGLCKGVILIDEDVDVVKVLLNHLEVEGDVSVERPVSEGGTCRGTRR
jgi:hypothetical protein